jgi:6-methylsalicylate decarboxylase
LTGPGPCVENDPLAATALARASNESAALIRDAHPRAYGFFASLPDLHDTDLALQELSYALDNLHADGVILSTRYGPPAHYLGHEVFIPIWRELNARKAVVFIHPTFSVSTQLISPSLSPPIFDFPHETGRAAIDMVLSDTLSLAPDCKIILAHAGGTLPYLIDRVAGMLPHTPFSVGKSREEILQQAKKFYFDTALSSDKGVLDLLGSFAGEGKILFGSDIPSAPREGVEYFTKNFEGYAIKEKGWKFVRGNALELFPRLRW